MEQWTTTTDTRIAAAFGTLGMVIRPKKTLDERTGTRIVRFHVAPVNLEGTYKTLEIRGAAERGELAAGHPFLTMLRAIENRRLQLELANHGRFCELVPVPGAPGIHHYQPGTTGLPGLKPGVAVIRTGDLKLVAALGIVGLPVMHIEGPEHSRVWYVQAHGQPRPGGLPAVDAVAFKSAWLADKESIPWEDPFAQAMRVLHNRERLLDVINRGADVVLLRRGVRKATVRADASDEAWDKASRFLG